MQRFLLLLAILCSWGTAHAERYAFKESVRQQHALAADGTVSVRNVNGNVQIEAWDRAEVVLEAEKSAATEEELRAIQLRVRPQADRFEVEVKLPKRAGWFRGNIRAQVHLTLRVPAGVRVDDVETVNSSVTITGVQGAVRASTVNGRMIARDLAGDARLSTVNGGVEAQFSALTTGQHVELSSVNGGITIEVPEQAGANLSASVVNGGIDSDLPLEVTGRVSRRNLKGTLNGGGARLEASTVNGGIRIRAR